MRRALTVLCLLGLMAGFGVGVYRYLDATRRTAQLTDPPSTPGDVRAAFPLPGTIVLAQHGRLFRLHDARFTDMELPQTGTWMQPAAIAGGPHLLAVLRGPQSSDVYELDSDGRLLRRLTDDAGRKIDQNHWAFWPRPAADGQSVLLAFDSPKSGYDVDFSIWAGTVGGRLAQHQWTKPNSYTGGDVEPIPLPGGGAVFVRYEIGPTSKVTSRIMIVRHPMGTPVALTQAPDACDDPALSPDGSVLAMICTGGRQRTRLVTARLQGTSVVSQHTLVGDCLCAAPAWSPGGGLVYLSPGDDPAGHFQLWWIEAASSPAPRPARQVTTGLDFDATSAPTWLP